MEAHLDMLRRWRGVTGVRLNGVLVRWRHARSAGAKGSSSSVRGVGAVADECDAVALLISAAGADESTCRNRNVDGCN